MLGGLDGHGFVGLALVPERLRYAIGAKKALASPDAFAGARVQVKPSDATDALIRALGATPVHISGDDLPDAVAKGEIDGSEASLGTNSPDEGQLHLTANVSLFPKTLTLFAGDGAYDRLDEDQSKAVGEAARLDSRLRSRTRTLRDVPGARLLPRGPAVQRGRGEPRRRRRAGGCRPARLRAAGAGSGHEVHDRRDPRAQGHVAGGSRGGATGDLRGRGVHREWPGRSPSAVNGTYHWRVTEAGGRAAAEAVGGTPHEEDLTPWAR